MSNLQSLSVIKIGGSLLEGKTFPKLARSLSAYIRRNPSVLVHGGGKEITLLLSRLKIKTKFVKGRRYTDPKTMEIVEMVLTGKMNPLVCRELRKNKITAIGMSGRTTGSVTAKRLPSLGQVGLPIRVNQKFLKSFLQKKQVPVMACIARDKKGRALNVNADEMAGAIAASLQADRLILFTNVPGILDQTHQTIPHITPHSGKKLMKHQVITGGMIPKVKSAFRALHRGVKEIWILHGKLPLFKNKGTLISEDLSLSKHPFS